MAHLLAAGGPETSLVASTKRGAKELRGRFRVGTYCPASDGTTRWLCIDFDGKGHAAALADAQEAALACLDAFIKAGLPAYLERSGGGQGWHLWVFFEQPIPAALARTLGLALAPKDALLADGGYASGASGNGIEVFPKQETIAADGFGNMVWLPWWHGAPDGANIFYSIDEDALLRPYTPAAFETVSLARVEHVLGPAGPSRTREREADNDWTRWRAEALARLPLQSVYGDWLTGKEKSKGWLECRDPSSPNGDRHPSAGVADGTGEAERGAFHSFISGKTVSVFDFLAERGRAGDFIEACELVANRTGVPLPASGQKVTSATSEAENDPRPENKADQPSATGEEIADRYIYVREQDAYLAPASGAVLTRAAINTTHAADRARGCFTGAAHKSGRKPSEFIDERVAQADNLGWWPGKPSLYDHHGKRLANTFRPPPAPPLDRPDPALWLAHLEWLIPVPAERDHLLDVLSYNVQHLEGKVNHAIALGGGIRTGKDLLLQPLSKWLRSSYVNVKHEDLDGAFTHYLKGAKFLTVQEARDLSFEQGFNRYNTFKTIIASPPDDLTINEKFMRPYKVPNLVQVIFLTNYPNGVYFEDREDGRYFVIWSPVEPRDGAYYVRLGAFVEAHFMDVIGFLGRRDVSRFNPKALPPSTAAREEMHAATRSGAELALVEAADELSAELGGVFTKSDLKAVAMRMNHRGLPALLEGAPARIGKTMKDAGLESTKIKVAGRHTFIYWQRGTMDASTAEQAYRQRARIAPAPHDDA